jgi:hypothetical protein
MWDEDRMICLPATGAIVLANRTRALSLAAISVGNAMRPRSRVPIIAAKIGDRAFVACARLAWRRTVLWPEFAAPVSSGDAAPAI